MDREPFSAPVEKTPAAFLGYIRNLIQVLEQSPTGRALVQAASRNNVSVGLDPLLEPNSHYFYPQRNHFDLGYQPDLLQKTEKGLSRYLISFICGLRRAWQYHHGHAPDTALRPRDFLRAFRCAEADMDAVTHLVAWELRAAGQGFLWRALLSGPNGDLAAVFERMVAANPHSVFDGTALKTVFNQWFAERERTNACDHWALETIDMALLDTTQRARVGKKALQRSLLQHVGLLPCGLNYLSGCSFASAWYDGLDDSFNIEHLRHIEKDVIQVIDNT
jgi:hypothetical protein